MDQLSTRCSSLPGDTRRGAAYPHQFVALAPGLPDKAGGRRQEARALHLPKNARRPHSAGQKMHDCRRRESRPRLGELFESGATLKGCGIELSEMTVTWWAMRSGERTNFPLSRCGASGSGRSSYTRSEKGGGGLRNIAPFRKKRSAGVSVVLPMARSRSQP